MRGNGHSSARLKLSHLMLRTANSGSFRHYTAVYHGPAQDSLRLTLTCGDRYRLTVWRDDRIQTSTDNKLVGLTRFECNSSCYNTCGGYRDTKSQAQSTFTENYILIEGSTYNFWLNINSSLCTGRQYLHALHVCKQLLVSLRKLQTSCESYILGLHSIWHTSSCTFPCHWLFCLTLAVHA